MKAFFLSLAGLAAAIAIGSFAAHAHTSPAAHEHPHAHALDGALMSYETLALTGLACIAAAGIVLALARIRRRK